MPIYEYGCPSCNHKFEELVMGGREPKACPKCGGKVKRQMSAFACGSSPSGGGMPAPASGGGCGHKGFS